ncbi:NUDIX hydrolase [Pseudofulvibacter geojedonensis]|uniref:NUDIX hydrolase n=1 Tax=Pseudofulvibacter geojedonensis TaxID=1123758 RepID=A0ABW3I1M9_9FLAO
MKTIKRARIVIFHDSKLLLLKKDIKKSYTFPGGVVKKEETLKEGLIREVYEEIGAKVAKKDLRYLASFSMAKGNKKEENHYYLLMNPEQFQFKLLETFKFSELSWVNIIKASNKLKLKERFVVEDILLSSYHKSYNDFLV